MYQCKVITSYSRKNGCWFDFVFHIKKHALSVNKKSIIVIERKCNLSN